jgi:o-succinylbenzoate---CoA ligase
MRTAGWLSRSAATMPDRLALVAGEERLTFRELRARAVDAAARLAPMGAVKGVRVGLAMEPSAGYAVALHGLIELGAVAVPLDPRLTEPELERRLERSGAALVLRDPAELAQQRPADYEPAAVELDDVHCVMHTSGTGGHAKAVELTYGNQLWSALGSAARIGIDPQDRWLCSLGLHHVGGLSVVLRSAIYGTAVVIEPFEADAVARVIAEQRITLASLVGTTLSRLLDAGAELDRLRCVLLGGGPVAPATLQRALAGGVPIAPTYGLTEAASQVTTLPPGEAAKRPGSAGTPILPTEVRIEDGAIEVRGATVAPGEAGPGGWLRTGDLGRLEDGHLYVLGRADDVIVTGGENVSPQQVEQALLAHPAVADAAAIGVEDPDWQHAVVAVVVPADGTTPAEDELREFCRERLAAHEVPKRISFARELPRNSQGKLLRAQIRPGAPSAS